MRRMRGTVPIDGRGSPPPVAHASRVVNLALSEVGTSPAINLVGTVLLPLTVAVRMTLGGVLGIALLQISLNGAPFSLPQVANASIALPGQPPDAQLMLTAGLFVAGDTFSITVPS